MPPVRPLTANFGDPSSRRRPRRRTASRCADRLIGYSWRGFGGGRPRGDRRGGFAGRCSVAEGRLRDLARARRHSTEFPLFCNNGSYCVPGSIHREEGSIIVWSGVSALPKRAEAAFRGQNRLHSPSLLGYGTTTGTVLKSVGLRVIKPWKRFANASMNTSATGRLLPCPARFRFT